MSKIEIVIASGNFGTLIECDTEITLRNATQLEYDRSIKSWDAGAYGTIGVEHEGSLRRCYVHRPLTVAELDQARAEIKRPSASVEQYAASVRARNMAGLGA